MMEESAVGDFANRLKFEFEDRESGVSEMDESQDWFVNDKRDDDRAPSPTKSENTGAKEIESSANAAAAGATGSAGSAQPHGLMTKKSSKLALPTKKSNTVETADEDADECGTSKCKTAFLHHIPNACGILVMELGTGDQVVERRYGSKFFRIYLPQVHEAQTDFCLFARKRLNKHKYRFRYLIATMKSRLIAAIKCFLDEHSMSKWNNPSYGGKVVMTPSPQAKKFKFAVPKAASARVDFDIAQEARKQELVVKLNAQPKRFNLFRGRAAAEESSDVYKSLIQKFINPLVEVRCPKSNNTVFKIEKEGDAGSEKYIVTYMRPFSLFVSCCLAVGVEAHLLD